MSPKEREMFHTQEKWDNELNSPIISSNPEAWLGAGYYFWYYENDAVWWGRTAKKRTKYYEVYKAKVNCENVLDTVFNEEHYIFWIQNVERAILKFMKNKKESLTLKYINSFFEERGIFEDIDGVMFQDISENPENWIVKKVQYKKRIQLVAYKLDIISNFALQFESECT